MTTATRIAKPASTITPIVPVETPAKAANKAVAFVNWSLPTSDGKAIRSSKGLPIFQNPEYPNPQEDLLVALAEKHGGNVEVTMKIRICLNHKMDLADTGLLDSIVIN